MNWIETRGKDLAVECQEYWKNVQGTSLDSQSDLLDTVRRFQDGDLSDSEREGVIRWFLCQNGEVRGVWREALWDIQGATRNGYRNCEDRRREVDKLSRECLGLAFWNQVSTCISRFTASRLRGSGDSDVMRSLSAYIRDSVHKTTILESAGLILMEAAKFPSEPLDDDVHGDDSKSDPEEELIQRQLLELLEEDIATGLIEYQKSCTLDSYIHEVRTDSEPRTQNARQQKKRLRGFLKSYLQENLEGCVKNLERKAMNLVMEKIEEIIWCNSPSLSRDVSPSSSRGPIEEERKESA
jgi:hypothetical protein